MLDKCAPPLYFLPHEDCSAALEHSLARPRDLDRQAVMTQSLQIQQAALELSRSTEELLMIQKEHSTLTQKLQRQRAQLANLQAGDGGRRLDFGAL